MATRLHDDEALCARVARARNWKVETVRQLLLDGSIGWCDTWPGCEAGALAFIYETGIKLRWRDRQSGERVIRWAAGKPRAFWREGLDRPHTHTLCITEGETDAIALLDAGVEDARRETLVVALPSASAIPPGAAAFATGRHVIIYPDDDRAGRASFQKLATALLPVAASIKQWKHHRL